MENGKWYIGQSVNITQRKQDHLTKLRSKNHKNNYLQSDFNLYDEKCFEFRVLELCEVEMLSIREKAWMEYYKSLDRNFGYNILDASESCNEDTRLKISQALKGRKFTSEWLKKMSDAKKGKKQSKELIEKRTEHMKGNKFRKGKIPTNAFQKGHISPMRGKKFTLEHRLKLSQAAKKRKKVLIHSQNKPIN